MSLKASYCIVFLALLSADAGLADENALTETEALVRLAASGAQFNPDDVRRTHERPVQGVGFFGRHRQITDEDLLPLKYLPSLEYVYVLSQERVTGSGLRHLDALKNLRTIDL